MKKKVKIIDPSLDKRWDTFIESHASSSIYNHFLWKDIVQNTYGYQPIYFVLEDSKNSIVAGIPFFLIKSHLTGNRLVSLSFSDYCDILYYNKEDINFLINSILDYSINTEIPKIEIRVRKSISCIENNLLFTKNAIYKNHVLFLNDNIELIKKRFHKSIKRNINISLKSDLEIIYGSNENDMKNFYDLYVMTRKYHGLPPQPYIFFKNLWNILHPNNMIYLMFAKENLKTIAGIALIKYKDTMYYIYGGSNRKFLRKRPNHLLFLNAINLAIQQGLHYFDFGRTSLENHGLMEFKKRWGTTEYDISHFYYTNERGKHHLNIRTYKISGITSKIFKKMPTPILKVAGKIIYKYFV